MNLRRAVIALCGAFGCLGLPGCGPTAAGGGPVDFPAMIENAKQRVYPALVFVKPIQEQYRYGERQRQEVWGSGVIISSDGYVVTNNHVAEKAVQVHCVLGDRELVEADVIGVDPETDLALLKLKPRAKSNPSTAPASAPAATTSAPSCQPALTNLPFALLGDSDKVDSGQFVMALGSPFGFERSISLGIISNTKRYLGFGGRYQYNLWIQTDAAINPGNSGGPLVDTRGEVIGINTLGVGGSGIGFAVPSNVVKDVVAKLKAAAQANKSDEPAKIRRAYTGMQLQALIDLDSTTITDSNEGVLIQSVDKNSPAEAAGVANGDILLSVNGKAVVGRYVEDLPRIRILLGELPLEQPVSIAVRRNGQDLTLLLQPVLKGRYEGEDLELRQWNMTVKEITKFSNPQLFYLSPEGGVFVQGVRYPGNAQDSGIQRNDIILKIGAHDIHSLQDVRKAYDEMVNDKARTEKKVLITIQRGAFREWKTLNWQKDYFQED